MNPSAYRPVTPTDFIGQTGVVAASLQRKTARLLVAGGSLKLLFYGAPGVGKTQLAAMVAGYITKHELEVETLNGRDCTADVVREWAKASAYQSMLGGWTVKVVNELDLCTPQAQDLLLSYLDKLPDRYAFLGTSNLRIDLLAERFATRMQHMKISPPTTSEIISFLIERWAIPPQVAAQYAVGSGGNVRAALMETETYMDLAA